MSMNEETLSRMQHMRLLGMHAAFKASQENFTLDKMTNDEFTSWLITNTCKSMV